MVNSLWHHLTYVYVRKYSLFFKNRMTFTKARYFQFSDSLRRKCPEDCSYVKNDFKHVSEKLYVQCTAFMTFNRGGGGGRGSYF